jgi:aspartyl-tRNA(Asn)/glutamyl-tRNA(Gln) amidotransferase subunit B
MQYESIIGLEIHAQLLTESKMFCSCSTMFGAEPNTQTCPVCIGMPGVLPVINKKAIEYVIKTGLALNCEITPYSRFARKNYFYPDLPKGYQISQYELPLCRSGYIEIGSNAQKRRIRLTRIHLEEDAGKNIHEGGDYSLVDLNRAGVPLMEIVTEPDIRNAQEAAEFMRRLRMVLRYLGVCDGNMEQGSLRCDANVSVRPMGHEEFGIKTEIKNMNSFKFIEKALEYEISRQIKLLNKGETIIQETRLWDSKRGITESMRSKEEAHDYRYFPEPDLMPVEINREWIEEIRAQLIELPDKKMERFIREYNLTEDDARLLTEERAMAEWFEKAVRLGGNPKTVANWMKGELLRLLNEDNRNIEECGLSPKQLVDLLDFVDKGVINRNQAKVVFEEMYRKNIKNIGVANITLSSPKIIAKGTTVKRTPPKKVTPEEIIRQKGFTQISDEREIEKIVDDILNNHPKEVERFRAGEQKLMGFFVGQVMKATKGKANPKIVNELLRKKLLI